MSSLFTDDKFVENCFLGILWQQSEWHPTFKEENKMEFEYWPIGRDRSIIGLFSFTIPRIFNTKNDTIQYQ